MSKITKERGWMLFDAVSGNAIDGTTDSRVAAQWEKEALKDENIVVIAFNVKVKKIKKGD